MRSNSLLSLGLLCLYLSLRLLWLCLRLGGNGLAGWTALSLRLCLILGLSLSVLGSTLIDGSLCLLYRYV